MLKPCPGWDDHEISNIFFDNIYEKRNIGKYKMIIAHNALYITFTYISQYIDAHYT